MTVSLQKRPSFEASISNVERCVADVLAIHLDLSTGGLRDDLDLQSRSHGVRVRCASGAHQENGGHQGWKNGAEEWEGPIHESCLIRKGSGSSRIFYSVNSLPFGCAMGNSGGSCLHRRGERGFEQKVTKVTKGFRLALRATLFGEFLACRWRWETPTGRLFTEGEKEDLNRRLQRSQRGFRLVLRATLFGEFLACGRDGKLRPEGPSQKGERGFEQKVTKVTKGLGWRSGHAVRWIPDYAGRDGKLRPEGASTEGEKEDLNRRLQRSQRVFRLVLRGRSSVNSCQAAGDGKLRPEAASQKGAKRI